MAGGTVCPKCGHRQEASDAWCIKCGGMLVASETEASDPTPAQPEKTAPGEPAASAFLQSKEPERPRTGTEPSSGPLQAPADAPEAIKRLPKGTVIDNMYSIVRVLGEGGMGVVYLAEDIHTGVEIVLKAVRPELIHRRDVRDRTLAEGRTLARIDHPNVVHLNAVVTDDTGLWLVMQYIEGESLDRTIKRYKADGENISFTFAIDIFRQVLQGVGAAHRDGVIHRDIKPANVLVRKKDGVAKVTDFGIAKPEEQARVGQGNTKGVIGSLWYMSPEQVQGRRDLDKRVDIYALGVLLFELLTGHVPFTAESSYEIMRLHVEAPFPKVHSERSDVPEWVDEVLARACAKKRDERFASCDEFLAAIDAHVGPRPNAATHTRLGNMSSVRPATTQTEALPLPEKAATTAGTTDPGTRPASRGWLYALLGVVTLAAAGAVVYVFVISDAGSKPKRTPVSAEPSSAASSAGGLPLPPPVASSAAPKADPLDALIGSWKSEAGTEFLAVRVGDKVEFRVVDPKQLAPADYVAGEARFILRKGSGDNDYLVEEKMRPQATLPFDPKSRTTCQEIWTEVDDKPLVASLAGGELQVDFAKLFFSDKNFKIENDHIVSCAKLAGAARGRGRTTLKKS